MARKPRRTPDIQPTAAEAKQKLDAELEEYAAVRKQEIKDQILAENEILRELRSEEHTLQLSIETKKTELTELSRIYLDDQADIRASSEEKERTIALNAEAIEVSNRELEKVKDEIRAAVYERDKILLITDKSREDHDKFLAYEKRARQILDDKDRELQAKAADVSQANQFLKSRRSFLPEL